MAEAFLESEGVSSNTSSNDNNEDLPSDTDSEAGDDLFSPLPLTSSIDTSINLSAPSSMETSVFECEVNECMYNYALYL